MKAKTEKFDLVVDNQPIKVKATPFTLPTHETRYRVSVNNSPVYIYAWHDEQKCYTILEHGSAAVSLPEKINEAIGRQLYSRLAA